MSQELIYTSAPRGLKPGSRGFCTVVSTRGMSAPLAAALEGLSGYRTLYPPTDRRAGENPVVFSHLQLTAAGKSYSVLSRISDYGLDYSQRSNKIAHHLVLNRSEHVPAGPAQVLAAPGMMDSTFTGEPRLLEAGRAISTGDRPPGVCRAWQRAMGDAGWAGVLAESFQADPDRQAYLVVPPEMDVLPLIAEAIALLPPAVRWRVTFSTYFTSLPPGAACRWRCVLAGSPEAHQSRRFVHALRLDLTQPMGQATGGNLVEQARTGRSVQTATTQQTPAAVAPASAPVRPAVETSPHKQQEGLVPLEGPPPAGPWQTATASSGGPPPAPRRRRRTLADVPDPPRRRWVMVVAVVLLLLLSGGGGAYFWMTKPRMPESKSIASRSEGEGRSESRNARDPVANAESPTADRKSTDNAGTDENATRPREVEHNSSDGDQKQNRAASDTMERSNPQPPSPKTSSSKEKANSKRQNGEEAGDAPKPPKADDTSSGPQIVYVELPEPTDGNEAFSLPIEGLCLSGTDEHSLSLLMPREFDQNLRQQSTGTTAASLMVQFHVAIWLDLAEFSLEGDATPTRVALRWIGMSSSSRNKLRWCALAVSSEQPRYIVFRKPYPIHNRPFKNGNIDWNPEHDILSAVPPGITLYADINLTAQEGVFHFKGQIFNLSSEGSRVLESSIQPDDLAKSLKSATQHQFNEVDDWGDRIVLRFNKDPSIIRVNLEGINEFHKKLIDEFNSDITHAEKGTIWSAIFATQDMMAAFDPNVELKRFRKLSYDNLLRKKYVDKIKRNIEKWLSFWREHQDDKQYKKRRDNFEQYASVLEDIKNVRIDQLVRRAKMIQSLKASLNNATTASAQIYHIVKNPNNEKQTLKIPIIKISKKSPPQK